MDEIQQADTLRPSEIFRLKGIPITTLQDYVQKLPPAERLPSIKIRGVKGRRGIRLINRLVLDLWLEWQDWRAEIIEPKAMETAEFKAFAAWLARKGLAHR